MSPSRTVPFVIGAVICDSGACALPVSSFPNVIAYGVKNKKGEQYLEVSDYLKAAAVIEISIIVIMGTVGWGLIQADIV